MDEILIQSFNIRLIGIITQMFKFENDRNPIIWIDKHAYLILKRSYGIMDIHAITVYSRISGSYFKGNSGKHESDMRLRAYLLKVYGLAEKTTYINLGLLVVLGLPKHRCYPLVKSPSGTLNAPLAA